MIKYWYKECPRCQQGRLFIMKYNDNDSLLLNCEECEWAFENPKEIGIVEKGFLAIDNPCDFADRNAIIKAEWEEYAINIYED